MKTHIRNPKWARPGRPAGFALVSLLLVVGVMAGFVAAYGTHVVLQGRGSLASTPMLTTREACQSALAVARQGLLAGDPAGSFEITAGTTATGVIVSDLGGGEMLVDVHAEGSDGTGTHRQAAFTLQPSAATEPDGPAQLPTLDDATISALLNDDELPRLHIAVSQRIEDADLHGLVIVHDGVQLELSGVVLNGCVISAGALGAHALEAFDASMAPRLVLDGDVRIDSHPALDGVAILMPDGQVAGGAPDARVQIMGDVVAHDVSLQQAGALDGHVAAVNAELPDGQTLDRLGADRRPEAWTGALQLGGTQEAVSVAFVSNGISLAELAPIVGYWNEG